MEMTEACNENLTITSDCPIPNVCNPLSDSRLIKTEMPDVSVNDLSRDRGYSSDVITESADYLSDGQPIAERPHVSVNDLSRDRGYNSDVITESADHLSDGQPIAEGPNVSVNDLPQEYSYSYIFIRTDPADSTLSVGELVAEKSDSSGNSTRHDLSAHSCVDKKHGPTDLIENHENAIPQFIGRRKNVPSTIGVGHEPFGCNVCDKKFSHNCFLTEHKLSHYLEKPFGCDICDKRFSRAPGLMKHLRLHTGKNLYVCDICDKRFTHPSNWEMHKRVHTGEKPFVCEFCDRGFAQSSDLLRHKRSHTGEKPFACDLCGRRFARSCTARNTKEPILDKNRYLSPTRYPNPRPRSLALARKWCLC